MAGGRCNVQHSRAGEFRLTPALIQVPYLGRFALGYRGSWDPVMMNFLVLANWHLFGYLMLLAAVVSVVSVFKHGAAHWQQAGLVLSSPACWPCSCCFPDRCPALGRAVHQHQPGISGFVPAFLFWVLTVFHPSPFAAHPALSREGSGHRTGASTRRYNAATARQPVRCRIVPVTPPRRPTQGSSLVGIVLERA